MKHKIPDIIRKNCFDCFKSLNEAERAVVMFGEEEYRKSLDLDNDDAPCWVMNSGETHGFVGWNPICVPTMDYIVWKLEQYKFNNYITQKHKNTSVINIRKVMCNGN